MSLTHLRDRGYVYIVGAGPGDPGLFSLKGKLVLENADVVLVDHLVHPSLLSFCKENTEIVYVGKQRGKHSITQKGINDYLKSYTDQKKIVVRLKGGDPFVFGRVGEEMQWLVKHNIAFEIHQNYLIYFLHHLISHLLLNFSKTLSFEDTATWPLRLHAYYVDLSSGFLF